MAGFEVIIETSAAERAAKRLESAMDGVGKSSVSLEEKTKKTTTTIDGQSQSAESLAAESRKAAEVMSSQGKAAESLARETSKVRDEFGRLIKAGGIASESSDQLRKRITETAAQAAKAQSGMGGYASSIESMGDKISKAFGRTEDAFSGVALGSSEVEKATKSLLEDMETLGHVALGNEKYLGRLEDRLSKGMKADKARESIDRLKKSLKLTSIETAKIQAKMGDYSGALDTIGTSFLKTASKFKTGALILTAATAATAYAASRSLKSFGELQAGLIGVQKTTNMTDEQMSGLSKTIDDMASNSVPVATAGLLDIAQVSGQLGVKGASNIAAFTETLGKLELASDIVGEEGAASLARLMNVTGESVSTVGTLGSVIVALGNNMAATESEILSLATEVGQATSVFSVSSAEASAMAAAMKSIGVRAELGGSVVGRAMRTIEKSINDGGESLQHLSKVTGIAGDKLKLEFETNATSVFKAWLEGVGKAVDGGESAASALEKFGLKGEEVLKVLPALATKTEILSKALEISNEQTKNATALNKEAESATKGYNAQMQLTSNTVKKVSSAFGKGMAPSVISVAKGFREWVGENDKLISQDIPTVISEIFEASANMIEVMAKPLELLAWSISKSAEFIERASIAKAGQELIREGKIGVLEWAMALGDAEKQQVLVNEAIEKARAEARGAAVEYDNLANSTINLTSDSDQLGESLNKLSKVEKIDPFKDIVSGGQSLIDSFSAYEKLYQETGIMTEEHYDQLSQLIENERDEFIDATGNKTAAQQAYVERLSSLDAQYYAEAIMARKTAESALSTYKAALAKENKQLTMSSGAYDAYKLGLAGVGKEEIAVAIALKYKNDELQRNIDLAKELANTQEGGEADWSGGKSDYAVEMTKQQKELDDAVKDYESAMESIAVHANTGRDWGDSFADGIGNAMTAMQGLLSMYDRQAEAQQTIIGLREEAASTTDDEKRADILDAIGEKESDMVAKQLSGYTELFGATAEMFDENSKAREVMHTAEMAFAAIELGMNLKKAISNAVVAVTTQGSGDPYTAFVRVAAMAAMMGGILSQIGGSISGGGGSDSYTPPKAEAATGTVLGDAGAVSESISKSYEMLEDFHAEDYKELRGIHSEMRSLNSNISGLVKGVVRGIGGEFTAESMGIQVGYEPGSMESIWSDTPGSQVNKYTGLQGMIDDLWISTVGKVISQVFGGGVTREMLAGGLTQMPTDTLGGQSYMELGENLPPGVVFQSQTLGDLIDGMGMNIGSYADMLKETEGGWFSSDDKDYYTAYQDLPEEIDRMFTNIFMDLGNTFVGIADILGKDVDIVKAYALDIGKIELQGLETADEINEAISAGISNISDEAATALFGEIVAKYQEVGEGMFETAVRVATEKVVVLETLETLAGGFVDAGIPSLAIEFTQSLLDMAGGIENFADMASTYYDKFFTDAEKQADLLRSFSAGFDEYKIPMPKTRKEFRELGDVVMASGNEEAIAAFLAMAEKGDAYYSGAEKEAEKQSAIADRQWDAAERQAAELAREQKRLADEELARLASLKTLTDGIADSIEDIGLTDFDKGLKQITKTMAENLSQSLRYSGSLEDETEIKKLATLQTEALYKALYESIEDAQASLLGTEKDLEVSRMVKRYGSSPFESVSVIEDWIDWFAVAAPEAIKQAADDLKTSVPQLIADTKYLSEGISDAAQDAANAASELQEALSLKVDEARGVYSQSLTAEIGRLESEYSALQTSLDTAKADYVFYLNEEITAQQEISNSAKSAASNLRSLSDSMSDYLDALNRSSSLLSPQEAYKATEQQWKSIALATKSSDEKIAQDAMARLPEINREFLEASLESNTTAASYAEDVAKVKALTSTTVSIAEIQAKRQDEIASSAETQISKLRNIIDEVGGTTRAVDSLKGSQDIYNEASLDILKSGLPDDIAFYTDQLTSLTGNTDAMIDLTTAFNDFAGALRATGTQTSLSPPLSSGAGSSLDVIGVSGAEFAIHANMLLSGAGGVEQLAADMKKFNVSVEDATIAYNEATGTSFTVAQVSDVLPGFSGGGWASGPDSGYPVILHGKENILTEDQARDVRSALRVGGMEDVAEELKKIRALLESEQMPNSETRRQIKRFTAGIEEQNIEVKVAS